ncbi:hypothetical protein [Nonomuraea typhae]|uniref:hypothetical protein n=1 Tax=Nonomuraea typhae TaxID=2603600 RepID=UPI0012FCC6CD|nr:hypothetical protein [Nonomuraea typhae]
MRPQWSMILVCAAVLPLAACAAGAPSAAPVSGAKTPAVSASSGAPSASSTSRTEDTLGEWMTCMRQNGVPVEDPRDSGRLSAADTGVSQQTLEKAQEACRQYVQPATGDRPNANDPSVMDKYLAFATCMRDNGVDMPDPKAGPNGEIEMKPKTATDSPQYTQAHHACQSKLPGGGEGSPGGGAR